MEGWIKSYRAILENPIVCKDADHFAVWGYLMHHAAHTPLDTLFAGKRITLKPGQLITGRIKIAEFFKIDQSKVRRILKLFESEQQIEQQPSNQSTLISICNWGIYQGNEQQNIQQLNNGCTTTEQQLNNGCTTTEQQLNTIQECKNIKNENNEDNDNNHTQTHTDFFDLKTFTRVRAKEFLEWLDRAYPAVQQMEIPFMEGHAMELVQKYTAEDIQRIIMAIDNKGATKNKSAYSTFRAFASNDLIIKRQKQTGYFGYTETAMTDMVNAGTCKATDFLRRGSSPYEWVKVADINRNV